MQVNFLDDNAGSGLRDGMIAVFVAGEMAGVGMLTAPWAVANMGESDDSTTKTERNNR